MVLSQEERVAATPLVPTVRKSARRATPAHKAPPTPVPPPSAQAVPKTSARKQKQQQSGGKRDGRKGKQGAPPQQPSPEEVARQGGLYFDMEGRPVFVEMKPAAFYGDGLMRPFIKLGEDNKRVMDRPFQPKLPNEPLLEWGKHAKWEKGGLRQPPPNATQAELRRRAEELREPMPVKPRAAWQFFADELIQKATTARDRFEGDDQAVRQLIVNEVRGLDKKRHRWVVPHPDEQPSKSNRGGKWAQLSAVEQEKYIKMHNEDVKRYDQQMLAWHRLHSTENRTMQEARAVEVCIKRDAARKAQAEQEAQAQQQREQQQQQQQEQQQGQQQPQHQQSIDTSAQAPAEDGNKQAKQQKAGSQKRQHRGGSKAAPRKQRKGAQQREEEEEEEEAGMDGHSDEEEEAGKDAHSDEEDEHEEEEGDENEEPPSKQQKTRSSPPRRQVLANAEAKLNASKGREGPASSASKKPTPAPSRSLPVKGGVKTTSTRSSSRAK